MPGENSRKNRLNRIESTLSELLQRNTMKDYYSTAEVAKILGKAEFTVRERQRVSAGTGGGTERRALGGPGLRAGHETCPQSGPTLSKAWGGVLPFRHHAGNRADQQLGRIGDSLRGHRPADYPGDAERERPPVVRADLDGDRHVPPSKVARPFSLYWIPSKPISPAPYRHHFCRQGLESAPTDLLSPLPL